jgi:plasmid stabilization system protein ParE
MHENVLFLEEAKSEFINTINYYEGIYSGLGLAFEKEVKKVINLITQFPSICSKRQDGTQRISIHRFPYQIIFFPYNKSLWIISIAHHKRFPKYWGNRFKNIY